MDIEYGHEDRWPANTWLTLWVETYNREPVLPAEMQPWLERAGLDTVNPESGLISIFGDSLVTYDEDQEIGRSMILVRDPRGLMTKAALLESLASAPWTPRTAGPHLPSVSYWPSLSDTTRASQGTIEALWASNRVGEEVVDTANLVAVLVKVGIVGVVGISLLALYKNLTANSRIPQKRSKKGRRR